MDGVTLHMFRFELRVFSHVHVTPTVVVQSWPPASVGPCWAPGRQRRCVGRRDHTRQQRLSMMSEPVPPQDPVPVDASASSAVVGAPGSAPPPPPPTWTWPRENERIEVEVAGEDEGSASTWMRATVTAVLIDGWFSARMDHDLEWVDWFTWQEVRTHAKIRRRTI